MKKYLGLLFAATFVLTIACGQGKEASQEAQGTDDEAGTTTATTATATTAAAPAAAPAAAVSADAGTITGVIKLNGTPPAMPAIQMAADPYCASQYGSAPPKDEQVVVGPDGGLANVFIYIKNISGNYPAPSTPVTLVQQGCEYHPHMVVVQVGQPFQIKNADATLHNIHAMPNDNPQFNEGQPVQGMVATKTFQNAETTPFRIKCDVHGWMHAWMAVMPNPFYAVSQPNGSFTIANVPPGQYTLVAWQEKYGTQEQQVTVGPKQSATVNFTFKG